MYTFMGVSNSEIYLSEKDLSSMEFNFFVRPASEIQQQCQIAPSQDGLHNHHYQDVQEEKEDTCNILVTSSELKLRSLGELKVREDDDNEPKTPTSMDRRIPEMSKCPPAPKKPKSRPLTKRKAGCRTRLLLDLSEEIDSMFPAVVVEDFDGKVKKIRQGNDS